MKPIIWSVKDISLILKSRQKNEFDGNLAVSGDRGNGKSSFISKLFYRFNKFDPWTHQVYNRPDVINLLKTQELGLCFDDEAINSGYKRNFQTSGQQELIKILTAYRDNFNIHASAIPNFFSLDKDLRDLYFLHIHIIERGIGVVHMPLQGRLYSQDRWDAKYNGKIEEGWSKRMAKDPNFRPPYHKLSTFRGWIYFNKLTPIQEQLYKLVKKTKRAASFDVLDEKKNELTFTQKIYNLLVDGKLTKEGVIQMCLMEGKKYSSLMSDLNRMLTDNGLEETVKDFLRDKGNKINLNKIDDEIKQIVPEI